MRTAATDLLPISNNYYCCLLCRSFASRRGCSNLFRDLLPMTDKFKRSTSQTSARHKYTCIQLPSEMLFLFNANAAHDFPSQLFFQVGRSIFFYFFSIYSYEHETDVIVQIMKNLQPAKITTWQKYTLNLTSSRSADRHSNDSTNYYVALRMIYFSQEIFASIILFTLIFLWCIYFFLTA